MTHHQALQDFPDASQVSLHENNKMKLPVLQEGLKVTSAYTQTFTMPFKWVEIYLMDYMWINRTDYFGREHRLTSSSRTNYENHLQKLILLTGSRAFKA
jgi:uncharacterized membrane protein